MPNLTAADIERMLRHALVTDFKAMVRNYISSGRMVMRLNLLPRPSLDRDKAAVIRVCRLWARRSRQVRRRPTRKCARRAMARR